MREKDGDIKTSAEVRHRLREKDSEAETSTEVETSRGRDIDREKKTVRRRHLQR